MKTEGTMSNLHLVKQKKGKGGKNMYGGCTSCPNVTF